MISHKQSTDVTAVNDSFVGQKRRSRFSSINSDTNVDIETKKDDAVNIKLDEQIQNIKKQRIFEESTMDDPPASSKTQSSISQATLQEAAARAAEISKELSSIVLFNNN